MGITKRMVKFSEVETLPDGDRKRVKLSASDGKRLIMIIRSCLEWGISKGTNGDYQTPLVVDEKEDFLEKFSELKSECIDHLVEHAGLVDAGFRTHLYTSEKSGRTTLYCNLPGGTSMRYEIDKKKKLSTRTCPKDRQHVDIVVEFESVSWKIGEPKSLSPKITAREIMFLEEKGMEWEDIL